MPSSSSDRGCPWIRPIALVSRQPRIHGPSNLTSDIDGDHMPQPILLIAALTSVAALAAPHADRDAVAQIDRTYQEAVKRNDANTMKKIMHPDFQLVLGHGRRFGRDDLLKDARRGRFIYDLENDAGHPVRDGVGRHGYRDGEAAAQRTERR